MRAWLRMLFRQCVVRGGYLCHMRGMHPSKCAYTCTRLHAGGVTSCPACMLASTITNGTLVPANTVATQGWANLADSQLTTVATYGDSAVTAATQPEPYIQVRLGQAYTDLVGVTLFPRSDSYTGVQESQNISVYMSTTAAFATDSNKVACEEGFTALIERTPTFIACSGAAGKPIQFVTVQRIWSAATAFSLQELQVQRSTGGCMAVAWPAAGPAPL